MPLINLKKSVSQLPPTPISFRSFKEEDANPTRGIEHDHLSSALDSFYASLGGGGAESGAPPTTFAAAAAVGPSVSGAPSAAVSEDSRGSNSPGPMLQEEERERKKKKTKLSTGLSMKKKGVENMVAKWQNIHDAAK